MRVELKLATKLPVQMTLPNKNPSNVPSPTPRPSPSVIKSRTTTVEVHPITIRKTPKFPSRDRHLAIRRKKANHVSVEHPFKDGSKCFGVCTIDGKWEYGDVKGNEKVPNRNTETQLNRVEFTV